jgi:kynureninase
MFSADETFAREMDAQDPLRDFREQFYLPLGKDSKPLIYFGGNSLGLMPKSARQVVEEELDNWAKLGVDAHHAAGTPWYSYHEALREPTARLVGAKPTEVVCMNSLTDPDGRTGFSFRHLRDKNADRAPWARCEGCADSRATAQR